MIIVCPKCATRLQVDEEKSPARPFNVRCPKCNSTVSSGVASPASEHGALAVGGSPSTEHPRFEQNTARAYEPATKATPTGTGAAIADDCDPHVDGSVVSKGTNQCAGKSRRAAVVGPAQALVCTGENYRDTVARRLTESGYQVFVAEDTRQAVETMRVEKDGRRVARAAVRFGRTRIGVCDQREINVLRPAQRRRIFFVLLSPSMRTMDAHAAFLSNVNLVVNVADVDELHRIMDVALREYNDLYREFNARI